MGLSSKQLPELILVIKKIDFLERGIVKGHVLNNSKGKQNLRVVAIISSNWLNCNNYQ